MIKNTATDFFGTIKPEQCEKTMTQLTDSLQPVLTAAGIGMWRYEPQTNILYLDELLRDIYELPATDALSLDQIIERIHPEDRDALLNMLGQPVPEGGCCTQLRAVLGDHSTRWLNWTSKPSADDDSIVGVCVDVSDIMSPHEHLRTTHDKLSAIVSGAPGKFSYLDCNYMIQFLSGDFRESLKIDANEYDRLLGRHTKDIFGEEVFKARLEKLDHALSGELVTFEDSEELEDGQLWHDIVTYKPDFDKDGKVCGVFTMRTAINDQHKLEEDLRSLTEELGRSNTDLEQFAYVASHDLKAPLRSIQVLVEWLTEDLQEYENGDVQENLELLSKRTRRLNNLLEDLLNYSRAGRDAEPPTAVNLGVLVEEIADMLNPDGSSTISITDQNATLITDPAALHQVMRNLIGNAIKHHPGPNVEILVSALDHGSHYEVSVADNGDGIAEEFSERVFQMFQTLRPRDEVEGSGMGLAIVERLIRNQGGKIWLESPKHGSGAVFKFTLNKREENE